MSKHNKPSLQPVPAAPMAQPPELGDARRESLEDKKHVAVRATEAIHDLLAVAEMISQSQTALTEMQTACQELIEALKQAQASGVPIDYSMRLRLKGLFQMSAWQITADERLSGELSRIVAGIPELQTEVRKEAWRNLWRAIGLIFKG